VQDLTVSAMEYEEERMGLKKELQVMSVEKSILTSEKEDQKQEIARLHHRLNSLEGDYKLQAQQIER